MVVVLTACPSTRNPKVCCISADDCAAIGLEGSAVPCADGLACVNNACEVASCSTNGCPIDSPVCNISTGECEGCSTSQQCDQFPNNTVCETTSGGCVECVSSVDCSAGVCDATDGTCVECLVAEDCSTTEPICDARTCRPCKRDSECASAACGDDGSCVDEANVLYLDPAGADVGSCTRTAPCRSITFAASRATDGRFHLVTAQGSYVEHVEVFSASAPRLFVHGHGASFVGVSGNDGPSFVMSPAATVRDLTVTNASGDAFSLGANVLLERIQVDAFGYGVDVGPMTVLRDVNVANATIAVRISGGASLTTAALSETCSKESWSPTAERSRSRTFYCIPSSTLH